MCTRPAELGLATVVSDHNLQATDNTWACQSVAEITQEARFFYWASKIFKFLVP